MTAGSTAVCTCFLSTEGRADLCTDSLWSRSSLWWRRDGAVSPEAQRLSCRLLFLWQIHLREHAAELAADSGAATVDLCLSSGSSQCSATGCFWWSPKEAPLQQSKAALWATFAQAPCSLREPLQAFAEPPAKAKERQSLPSPAKCPVQARGQLGRGKRGLAGRGQKSACISSANQLCSALQP